MINSFTSLEQLTNTINGMTVGSLREVARDFGIVPRNRKRDELIKLIIDVYNGDVKPEGPKKAGRPTKVSSPPPTLVESTEPVVNPENVDPDIPHSGILEIMPDGYGFVRTEQHDGRQGLLRVGNHDTTHGFAHGRQIDRCFAPISRQTSAVGHLY